MDRYYQCHKSFDKLEAENKHFICRIKASTKKTILRTNEFRPEIIVFYDAIVLLGTPGLNQTEKEVRVIGYHVDDVVYYIAADRYDLTAEQIAFAYRLWLNIEIFFAWWKRRHPQ